MFAARHSLASARQCNMHCSKNAQIPRTRATQILQVAANRRPYWSKHLGKRYLCLAASAELSTAVIETLENKLAAALDPDRVRIFVENEVVNIEVAAYKFENFDMPERQDIVLKVIAEDLKGFKTKVMPFTPPEYFASLKKWC